MENIIIFGTSLMAEQVYMVLQNLNNYKVIAWTDNDPNKSANGNKKFGLPIIPVSSLKEYNDARIIIASSYYLEIGIQLSEMGITNFYDNIYSIVLKLTEVERKELKQKLQPDDIPNINLNYQINDTLITSDEDFEKDKYLVLLGNYPTVEIPYSYAFVHRRIIYYKKAGLNIDVFCYKEDSSLSVYTYDSVKVYKGDFFSLQILFKKRRYKKILIHFMNIMFYHIIKRMNILDIPTIIWCHGYEVLRWSNVFFNYTKDDINKYRTFYNLKDKEKIELFNNLFNRNNFTFIFVSNWLKNSVFKFIGALPINYYIISNFIDNNLFEYHEKTAEDRKKIISIKSNKKRTYANDITAKAIIELSYRDFFNELTFNIYGEGELFEENFSELFKLNFTNVKIHKVFLQPNEIAELFNENGMFLSPTRRDTQGVISGEAMSAGLAVISCNVAAVPEFIDEDCGSLYEYDNYIQLADEIEFFYYHPEEFLRRTKNGADRVRKQCGYEATIKKEIELITKEE